MKNVDSQSLRKRKDNMNKKVKIIVLSSVALVSALGITVGAFFGTYPITPDVEIKSADERVNNNETLLVASYNTAAPWGNMLKGTYTTRRAHLFAQQINNTLPDVLGVQELNSFWQEKMAELLPQYGYYGVKRGGDDKEATSEMSGIFYLKDKFELLESDTFWISLTPETESRFEGAACHRICSYVVLKNKNTGYMFAHFNTHLDHVSTEAQNLGGNLIAEKAEELKSKYGEISTVITGDFNQYPDGLAVQALLQNGFVSACALSENGKTTPTYHGWGEDYYDAPIDFIFADESFNIKDYKVHNEKIDDSYVSDHFMITAEMEI